MHGESCMWTRPIPRCHLFVHLNKYPHLADEPKPSAEDLWFIGMRPVSKIRQVFIVLFNQITCWIQNQCLASYGIGASFSNILSFISSHYFLNRSIAVQHSVRRGLTIKWLIPVHLQVSFLVVMEKQKNLVLGVIGNVFTRCVHGPVFLTPCGGSRSQAFQLIRHCHKPNLWHL